MPFIPESIQNPDEYKRQNDKFFTLLLPVENVYLWMQV
jgi:hypothetical protein